MMTTANGFTITILIPSGAPDGVRTITKSGWDGKGAIFPRALYQEARERSELREAGVYILWGERDSSELPLVYIGEADRSGRSDHYDGPVGRIYNHDRNKEFWTQALAFTSENLTKAHTIYLEARLIELATEAKRCELDNTRNPNPKADEATEMQAEGFLANMLLCLPIIGVNFFERPRVPQLVQRDHAPHTVASEVPAFDQSDVQDPPMAQRLLTLDESRASAHGYDGPEFVVLSGARGTRQHTNAFRANYAKAYRLREELLKLGVLADDGENITLTQDYSFNSPSLAAAVLMGTQVSGLTAWKDHSNRTLKEIREGS